MATTALIPLRIVANGGAITSDKYKSYYSAGTAASEDWKAGEILYLDGAYLKRIGTAGTASSDSVNTDDTGFSAAYKRFLALVDHDSSLYDKDTGNKSKGDACTVSQYVTVQEILQDTILEAQIAASGSTAPTIALLKTAMATYDPCSLYKSAADVWGIDVDENEDKGVFKVTEFDSDTQWMKTETGTAGTNGTGRMVRGTLIASLFV